MEKSNNDQSTAMNVRRRVQTSTTLNRNYVQRPQQKNVQDVVRVRMNARKATPATPAKVSPVELKNRAIEKALKTAEKTAKNEPAEKQKFHFGFGRVMLALGCTAAAVFAIVYFVNLNMPDLSLRVAAMQTGIEATYPSYVPRDFSLSGITSEDGKITLNFANSSAGDAFTLVEEKSSWDSNALVTNFVKSTYGDNYVTLREQGLTIYVNNSNAAWVSGGIVYKLTTTSGSLTKKQIKSIAVSL